MNAMIAAGWAAVDTFASLSTRSCGGRRHELVDHPQMGRNNTPVVLCGNACGRAVIVCPIDLNADYNIEDGAKNNANPTPDPPPRRGGDWQPIGSGVNDAPPPSKCRMELSRCKHDSCYGAIHEKVVGDHNHVELTGPATGQVVYSWETWRSTMLEQ
jgi:hypothetical protein